MSEIVADDDFDDMAVIDWIERASSLARLVYN